MVRHILGIRSKDYERQYLDINCPKCGFVDAMHICMDCPHHADPTNEDVVWGAYVECAYPAGWMVRMILSIRRAIHVFRYRITRSEV
jgi:hypothetical protein